MMSEKRREFDHEGERAGRCQLAHDLRNALAPISSSLEVLRRIDPISKQLGPFLDIIARQIAVIQTLISGISGTMAGEDPRPHVVAPDTAGEVGLPCRRIVIVDDSRSAIFALRALLEVLGQEVRTSDNPREALELIRTTRPDMVFLDLNMPEFSGFQLADKIRQFPELNCVRLIAASGLNDAADWEQARGAGFDRILVKPIDIEELRKLLSGREPEGAQGG